MELIIAEKPSVGKTIAAALGVKESRDGYLQGGGILVSWCIGHLVELALPDAPVITGTSPEVFRYYKMDAEGIAEKVKELL